MLRWDLFEHYLYGDPNLIFLQAAWTTLWISVVAQTVGVILGLFLALMRMSRFKWLNGIAGAYIWFFRGSPLLVQVLLLWDALPKISINNQPILLSAIGCVLVAFSLNEGAYMAEIIRAGIGSVDPGQMEAGKALGMRFPLAMRRIILPQAARVIVPPLGNEFNNMLKTTSIASVIGVFELTNVATVYGSPTFSVFELLLVATLYYLALTTLWGYVQGLIEKQLDPNRNQKVELVESKSLATRMMGFGTPRVGGSR
jgi:polar amino acid transport system permease protein